MPTKRATRQARALEPKPLAKPNAKPASLSTKKKYGKANPDFAAMAGWRAGFGSPYHKSHIVRTLRNTSALCPNCKFDLINQRRPDCPQCHTPIDPDAVLIQSAPPGRLLLAMLVSAVVFSWLGMIAGGFAWSSTVKAVTLTGLFTLQLAGGWLLLTIYTDTKWYCGVSAPNRKLLLAGAILGALAAAGVAVFAIVETL
ncbi:MAG: hypothetical protein AAFR76_04055 [Planctomycetota bacterium]